jgi:hypothetical protein
MPEGTYTEHTWVVAANVPVDLRSARRAQRRGNLRIPAETKIEALEVYCEQCKRPMDDVVDEPCIVSHFLHGGPIGTRKRRNAMGVEVEDEQVFGLG